MHFIFKQTFPQIRTLKLCVDKKNLVNISKVIELHCGPENREFLLASTSFILNLFKSSFERRHIVLFRQQSWSWS